MGVCESKGNENQTARQNPEIEKKPESINPDNPLHKLKPIAKPSKSVCKLIVPPNQLGSGFLIKFSKGEKEFYCLMTNEHVVTKKMVENKITIDVYYDSEDKNREIELNSKERFIKDFKDITIDATVIQILPKDNISNDYFLLPQKDYMDNYDKFIGKEITIIQYPQGEMNFADGTILERTPLDRAKYEFVYDASTDEGSSGSPIFLKGTKEVIGIHKFGSGNKNIKKNFGDFIWPIFCYFKNNINYASNGAIVVKNGLNNANNIYDRNNPNIINNINSNIQNNSGFIQNDSNKDKFNEITIIYEISIYDYSIKLFGEEFVKNNINKCYLLIDEKEIKLCKEFTLNLDQ